MDMNIQEQETECGEKAGNFLFRNAIQIVFDLIAGRIDQMCIHFLLLLILHRSPNNICTGTDLNRNWGYHWNDGGSSSNPCSDSYMGQSAFSEIENQNVRDFLTAHKDTIKYYVNLHSYSQLVLLPWGFTENPPMPVYDRYLEVANKVFTIFRV